MPYEINTNFKVEKSGTLQEGTSYANGVSFALVMDRLKYPNVEYSIQTVALPDMSITGAPVFTPQRNITAPPDKVDYGTFEITFLVDEYLSNYQEIHDWMVGMVTETDNTKEHKKTRDMTLQILTSHNNVAREIVLVDAYPINLSSLPFDTTITDTNYLVASVSFNYSYFKIV